MRVPGLGKLLSLIPPGNVGLAIKVAVGLAVSVWWSFAPGAEEASDVQAKAEKRQAYSRHYAFKGRMRKEFFLQDVKYDRAELTPSRDAAQAAA